MAKVPMNAIWQAEHGQDEDQGRNGPESGHAGVRQQDATGGLRGPGRGKEPGGSQTD